MDNIQAPEQQAAHQQRQDGAADYAVRRAQEHLGDVHHLAGLHSADRSRGSYRVHNRFDRHRVGEGNQQEAARSQRGVDEVLAQSAEAALADYDGEHGTDHRDIQGRLRSQGQGQQKTGNHRAAVPDSAGLFAGFAEKPFRRHSGNNCQCHNAEGVPAVYQDTHNRGRQQAQGDHPHDERSSPFISCVRSRGKIQHIHF